jgi:hypothetical protein
MPQMVRLSRLVAGVQGRSDRLARVASLFTFVNYLVEDPMAGVEPYHDGVDELMRVVGRQRGPAVALAALLRASGERVELRDVAGTCYVQVQVSLHMLRSLKSAAACICPSILDVPARLSASCRCGCGSGGRGGSVRPPLNDPSEGPGRTHRPGRTHSITRSGTRRGAAKQ